MRIRTVIAVGCATLAVAACATTPASAATATRLPGSARSASPKQLAEADAASMLAAFRSPPGAQRSGPIAAAGLSAAPSGATPDFVSRTAWWRVPGTMDATLAWVAAHRPAGFTLGGSGSSSDRSGVTSRFDQFSLPSVPNVLSQRSLYVSVARDGTDGTALRVDSQVTWLPVKSPSERIPAAARVVTILALPGLSSGGPVRPISRFYAPVTVTAPATVAKIAKVVDGLPLMPRGVFSCPADTGQGLRLTFRATKKGPVLAQVTAGTDGCGTVMLTVDGKRMPTLWGGARMAQQVLKLAGIHWAGF
jgi:hypothetical protein